MARHPLAVVPPSFFRTDPPPHTADTMTETKTKSKKKAKPAPPAPAPAVAKHPNLLRTRREKGIVLSMAQVAKLVDLDEATVSRHETGARGMNREQILKYAKLYGCETHELFVLPEEQAESAPAHAGVE